MIFRIAYLIAEREETALAENFRLLEANICAYFELEESMAGAINHDFTPHKLAHQSLLIDLQCVRKNLEEKNGKWSDGDGKAFSVFWAKSFFQHIKDSEMLMQAFPNTDHYDLHPA